MEKKKGSGGIFSHMTNPLFGNSVGDRRPPLKRDDNNRLTKVDIEWGWRFFSRLAALK